MDLSEISIVAVTKDAYAPHRTSAERQRLRRQGKCIHCAYEGHKVANCWIEPYRQPDDSEDDATVRDELD
jgi:hypothetical protein